MAESDAAKLALNQSVAMSIDRSFSTRLDDWGPTDRKSSGRCWLFAATNLDHCANDGGQWNLFVNIALKYGLVPRSATRSMNAALGGAPRNMRGPFNPE